MSGKDPVYYTDTSYNTVLRVSTDAEGIETDADKAVMKEGAKGWRLPTEAEWEYAARGGGTPSFDPPFSYSFAGTAGGTSYVELSYYAWFTFNSDTTQPVGGKYENSLGLYDMSGNVAEWCWDWAAVMVSEGTVTDPRGPATPGNFARIHRGGGYMTSAGLSPSVGQGRCSVATRDGWEPYRGKSYLGFRVVLCP
jgi:formylglycine-generating enzyme required for sulfatase activity